MMKSMHPILFKFGNIAIYTYGLMMALAFFVGISLARKEAERVGQDPEQILDLSFYILIAAVIGSRLFYVFTDPKNFIADPVEIFRIWNGGLVFYGGFILAVVVGMIYVKKTGMVLWQTADVMAPGLAVGQAIGRIGCFFAGCCYGKVCDMPWAIVFRNPDSLAPQGIPLHPTQLYSFLSDFSIFVVLWLFRKKTQFRGQLFWAYVLLYGITRFMIENYRGDFRGETYYQFFSVSQVIGLCLASLAAVMLFVLGRKAGAVIK
jgi:phosphatidylglycerol---prolipoprotein diacylglyceryl transferase